ncbi:SWR1-complex protein 4 [Trametes pubescens]|uniref:SWR1-complex protein 4 n=1 Tax=Trametes pubescens TaxID=154538 RepID=A0A1M2VHP6_TRAPU|nr:SWR1-complex protein 4 [Trametes pubescens]
MAASAADVRSILSIPTPSASTSTPQQKKPQAAERAKKPDGIPRELYALIGPSAPAIATQFAKPRLKQKPNLGSGGRVKWEWRPFKNAARSDGLRLSHWAKGSTEPDADYPWAKYNIQTAEYVYSQDEYSRLLEDQEWTKEETDYLFKLVREYDGRFYVVHDRYDYPHADPRFSPRTLEDIKDRYFSVCRKLVRNRPWAGDEASKNALLSSLSFDKSREITRKQYVKDLETRTPEQIIEEDALYLELEKLKENERRFRKDRDELLRTLLGIESGLPDLPIDDEGLQGPSVEPKKKKKGVASSVEPQTPITPSASNVISLAQPQPPKKTAKSAAYDILHCITRTDASQATKAPHQPVHLRSTKIPAVKPPGATQRVAQVLNEIGISHNRLVMPTAENIARMEPVLSSANSVVDMKKSLDKVEQDLRIAKARLAALRGETAEEGSGDAPQTPMEVEEGADAESVAGDRAQSVVSTKSTRSRRQI